MASAWGKAWGSAWGNAWGTVSTDIPKRPHRRVRIGPRLFTLPADVQDEAEIIAILAAVAPLLNRTH